MVIWLWSRYVELNCQHLPTSPSSTAEDMRLQPERARASPSASTQLLRKHDEKFVHADGLELQARRRDRFKALAMLQLLLATHHFKHRATLAWDIGLLSYAGIEERWVSLTNAVHKTLQVLLTKGAHSALSCFFLLFRRIIKPGA